MDTNVYKQRPGNQVMEHLRGMGRLSDYIQAYFNLLVGQYNALPDTKSDAKSDNLIQSIINKQPNTLTFDDLFNFEAGLLKLFPLEDLRRKAWKVHSDYRSVAGQSQYDLYLKSNPPDPHDPNIDAEMLRADLLVLTGEIYRIYALIPVRERIRVALLRTISLYLFSLIALSGWYLYTLWQPGSDPSSAIPVVWPVLISGAIGGFISTQRRIQSTTFDDNATTSLFSLFYGRISVILAPLTGAVFAILLFLIFVAGYVKGTIFPTMVTTRVSAHGKIIGTALNGASGAAIPTGLPPSVPTTPMSSDSSLDVKNDKAFTNLMTFLKDTGPDTGADFAGLLIWSFLAGFLERLVPDTLDQIATRKATNDKTKDVKA